MSGTGGAKATAKPREFGDASGRTRRYALGVSEEGELRVIPGRRVRVEDGVVTKVFRSKGARALVRDQRRADHETRVLRGLAERGVRVPAWLGTERLAGGGFAVRLAEVPGARTVDAALRDATSARPALMRAAGELVASLHAAGLDQPDLHAGNALVDGEGALWAIDFHQAELHPELGLGVLLRDLVKLCAAHRESLGRGLRQRFFIAWWRALPGPLREACPARATLAASIEERATRARLTACANYAKPTSRYFRISSTMRPVASSPEGQELAPSVRGEGAHPELGAGAGRRGAQQATADLLVRTGSGPTGRGFATAHAARIAELERAWLADAGRGRAFAEAQGWQVVEGPRSEVEAAWGAAARLHAHGLAGAWPLLLDRREARRALAVLDWNTAEGAPAAAPRPLSAPPAQGARRAALDAALAFRGLAQRAPAARDFCATPGGTLLLTPSAQLVARDTLEAQRVANHKRRERRARLFAAWPHLAQAPWLPVTRGVARLAAGALRFTPVEARLRKHLDQAELPVRPTTAAIRRHLAHLFVEWGQLGGRGFEDELFRRVHPGPGLGEHADLLRNGALVITPHLGNWEWLAAYLVAHAFGRGEGVRGAVIGRLRRRDPIATQLVAQRGRAGVETLSQNSHPRELVRRLARGDVIGLLPDVEVSRLAGVRLPFLGKEALVMTAPAALARASRRPLLPAACIRRADGDYELVFGDPIPAPRSKPETLDVTRAWVAVFEAWIRAHPEQWLWLHDRWRTPPSPSDTVPLGALLRGE